MALSFRRFSLLLPAALLTAFLLPGCHPRVTDPNDPKFIVAETPDFTVTKEELDHDRDEFLKEKQVPVDHLGSTEMAAVQTAVLRNIVTEKLLLARAEKENYKDLDKDEAEALGDIKGRFPSEQAFTDKLKATDVTEDELKKRIHDQVLIRRLLQTEALHDVDPTAQEVVDFYNGHRSLFNIPPKVRASRILVMVPETATAAQKTDKKKAIEAARARVVGGQDFSKVAMETSEDKYSAPRGGDIGYFQRGENEPGFDEVAFSSRIGVVSPVFETPLGYQFLKVTETRPAGMLALDDARAAIVENLRRLKAAQLEQAYVQDLQKSAAVKYNIPLTEPPSEPPPPAAGGIAPAPPSDTVTTTNAAPGGP